MEIMQFFSYTIRKGKMAMFFEEKEIVNEIKKSYVSCNGYRKVGCVL